jgi:hypothetical protein
MSLKEIHAEAVLGKYTHTATKSVSVSVRPSEDTKRLERGDVVCFCGTLMLIEDIYPDPTAKGTYNLTLTDAL